MTPPDRERLHELVDELPDEALEAAAHFLRELARDQVEMEGPWSGEGLLSMAGTAEGPRDLAANHDRYLDP